MKPAKLLLCLLCALLLTGCLSRPLPTEQPLPTATEPPAVTQAPTEPLPVTEPTEAPTTEPAFSVRDYVSAMTLREKAAQLFLLSPETIGLDASAPEDREAIREILEEYPVGGLILFSDHLISPEQVQAFHRTVRECSALPPFFCVDEEGGLVARLANHPAFDLPEFSNAGDVQTTEEARDRGRIIGTYLKELGFNLDLAPVADVNTNPQNPVIGDRAFSSDPETAAQLAKAFALGLNEAGISAAFKHFPGHGDTAEDSHAGLAVSHKTREELAACEWIPFRQAGPDDFVMVGHIAVPEVTGNFLPATLSPVLVTDILKKELGFSGLVLTDSMTMGAITQEYGSAQAAILALEAGCHLILMPEDPAAAIEGLEAAVRSGEFPESRLDTLVEQVLAGKLSRRIWVP